MPSSSSEGSRTGCSKCGEAPRCHGYHALDDLGERAMTRRRLCGLGISLVIAVGATGGCASTASMSATLPAGAAAAHVPDGDWTRFNFDAAAKRRRAGEHRDHARTVHQPVRRRVHLDGTVDSSAIELHAITVRGRVRDVAIVTTTYGRTIAIDPGTGSQAVGVRAPATSAPTRAAIRSRPPRRSPTPTGATCTPPAPTAGSTSSRWPPAGRFARDAGRSRVTLDATHEKLAASLNISGAG